MAFAQGILAGAGDDIIAPFKQLLDWYFTEMKICEQDRKAKTLFHDLCRKVMVALWNILEWQAQTVVRKNSRPFWVGGRQENIIPN